MVCARAPRSEGENSEPEGWKESRCDGSSEREGTQQVVTAVPNIYHMLTMCQPWSSEPDTRAVVSSSQQSRR